MAPRQVGTMGLGFLDREGRGMAMGFNGDTQIFQALEQNVRCGVHGGNIVSRKGPDQPCCFVSINMELAKPGTMAIISLRRRNLPGD